MIKVNSKVKLNMPKIKQLSQAQITALELTAEALRTEVVQAQVMPRDTGSLQNEQTHIHAGESVTAKYKDGTIVINSISKAKNGKVIYSTTSPQGRRLYYHPEYNFQKMENPNARGKWFEPWISGEHANFSIETYKKIYKELAGL